MLALGTIGGLNCILFVRFQWDSTGEKQILAKKISFHALQNVWKCTVFWAYSKHWKFISYKWVNLSFQSTYLVWVDSSRYPRRQRLSAKDCVQIRHNAYKRKSKEGRPCIMGSTKGGAFCNFTCDKKKISSWKNEYVIQRTFSFAPLPTSAN